MKMEFLNRLKFRLGLKVESMRISINNVVGYYIGHRGNIRVFLSSTYTDLAAERQALSLELSNLPITLFRMEEYTGVPKDDPKLSSEEAGEAYQRARNWSWKTTEHSDVVVILTGKRYGESGTTLLSMFSFVQMEFGWARDYGPKKTVLPYKVNVPFPDDNVILERCGPNFYRPLDPQLNRGELDSWLDKLTLFQVKLNNWYGLKEVNTAAEFLSIIPNDVRKAATRIKARWYLCRVVIGALLTLGLILMLSTV